MLLKLWGGGRAASAPPTGEVTRAPLYVNSPWKRWAAPELFPNIAALIVVGSGAIPQPTPEPTYFKRSSPQIEQSVNVAILNAQGLNIPALFDQPATRRTQAPDLYPNLAVATQAPTVLIPAPVEPTQYRRTLVQPDLTPNLSLGTTFVYNPPSAIFDQTFTRHTPALELYPNLAVNLQTQITWPLVEPVRWKRTPQVEYFPNIAVNLQTQVTRGTPEPTYTRKLSQFDLFPNLAVRAPAAIVQLNEPQEPTIRKRIAPIPDVIQNRAIYAPPELKSRPTQVLDPTFTKRWTTQSRIDLYPNIAALASSGGLPPFTAAEVGVRAFALGYFANQYRNIDDTFVIVSPYEYSPYWMTFTMQPPSDWTPYLSLFVEHYDREMLEFGRPV